MIGFWLKLGGGWPLWAGLILLALALGAAWLGYRPGLGRERAAGPLLLVRALALGFAALVLLHPVLAWPAGKGERRRLAVLLDDSRSMGIRDSVSGLSRAEAARRLLFGEEGLAARLGGEWDLAYHLFAREPVTVAAERAAAVEGIAQGPASRIEEAVRRVAGADAEGRLGAMVVLTDGRETDEGGPPLTSRVPVHLVGLGSAHHAGAGKDVAIRAVHAQGRALLANQTEAALEVTSRGLPSRTMTLTLARGGETVLTRRVEIHPGENQVELAFVPKVAGHHEYEVALAPDPAEEDAANNRRTFVLGVDPRRLRVLVFAGEPRWKFKFLRQALLRDRNLAATFHLKTNPARLLQQGAAPVALHGGFPADLKSLSAFDCVVLGDVGRDDLSESQWRLLATWVDRAGGGLVFLGGPVAWSGAGVGTTPLAEILPGGGGRGELQGRLQVEITRDGQGHPVLAGLEGAFRGALGRLLTLGNLFRLEGLRPGAQLLAAARGPGGESHPLLAVQQVGGGRVLVFASDTDWQWVMEHRQEGGEEVFQHLWSQAVRWVSGRDEAVRTEDQKVSLVLERSLLRVEERLRVRVEGEGIRGAQGVVAGGGRSWPLPFAGLAGGLAALFVPEAPGVHEITARVERMEGPPLELKARFLVERDERETAETTLDQAFLERIAAATGGAAFTAATAGQLPAVLERGRYRREEVRELHPRSTPLVFLAAMVLLGVEWWVRRRRYGL